MPKPLFARRVLVVSPTPTYPFDFGNRIRIYEMTKRFQAAGAKVDFLYSPMEWNTSFIDFEGYRQMVQQWDRVFLVPSESKYYTRPKNTHYEIDEWWEAPLHQMLEWLLLRQYYDCVVVNYAFLSKTLELVKGSTLKVLDTHDQMAGRKEILEGLGLEPDFFYLTENEEARALNRADVVVAIKDEEAKAFRNYTSKDVVTYPYPGLAQSWIYHGTSKVDDVNLSLLRVGFVGGLNQLNINCIRSFIANTRDLFAQKVAPLVIKIGGSVCEAIEDLAEEPHVKLLGRYDEPRDFYSQCDVIINPMLSSTGLKIKTVEAVSLGMPLLSTSHASEGLPDREPSLLFADDWELAKELVEASFDRSRLETYRKASNQALIGLQTQASQSFEAITTRINENPCLLIISNPELDRQSDYRRMWLNTLIYYLREGSEICMTTPTGIIPPLDLLKRAYGWQTECLKFVGDAGHESVVDHFFAASFDNLCDTRTSISCCFAAVPPKDQLAKALPSLKRLKTVMILEELCEAGELAKLIVFLTSNGIRATLVSSRLGAKRELLSSLIDFAQVLPYRHVDDLRDFFPTYSSSSPACDDEVIVNMVKRQDGERLQLSQFIHVFERQRYPIENNILVDEDALLSMHSFILLLRIFGISFRFKGPAVSTAIESAYLKRLTYEDPSYVFASMSRNDAGWANIWKIIS
jgi:hypothetical protein